MQTLTLTCPADFTEDDITFAAETLIAGSDRYQAWQCTHTVDGHTITVQAGWTGEGETEAYIQGTYEVMDEWAAAMQRQLR